MLRSYKRVGMIFPKSTFTKIFILYVGQKCQKIERKHAKSKELKQKTELLGFEKFLPDPERGLSLVHKFPKIIWIRIVEQHAKNFPRNYPDPDSSTILV